MKKQLTKKANNASEKIEKLKAIKEEIINLKNSPLYDFRQKEGNLPVIGEGSHSASVMFIGEAPGANEAKQGRPFCGTAGKILDELLITAGFKREEVYVTNIVKDRPPGNRDPELAEIELYAPFLMRQINTIKPDFIITLGRFSGEYIMAQFNLKQAFTTIGKVHGTVFEGMAEYGKVKIIPMYHPASALYDRTNKEKLVKDFKKLKAYLQHK
ncbi:MAG: uracil-DNA glycosylase [Candidatus Spechtbacterales bacterium]